MRRTRKGFTLMELLLVIGILVILAGAAVPYFINRGKQAKIDLVKAAIGPNGTLTSALDLFNNDMGRYPTTEEGLAALQTKPAGDDAAASKWAGPYLKPGVELTDPWGSQYQYKCPGENNAETFDLSSAGPDAVQGNEDDIGNWTAAKSG